MLGIKQFSIKQKLVWMIGATAVTALLLTCSIFIGFGMIWSRHQVRDQLSTLASLIAYEGAPVLEFAPDIDDRKTAQQVVDALRASRDILGGSLYLSPSTAAALHQSNTLLYVEYHRKDVELHWPGVPPSSGNLSPLEYVEPVTAAANGNQVGTVYLRYDARAEARLFWQCAAVAGGAFVLAIGVAFTLAARFQRLITSPILKLLQTTRRVSEEKDYSIRAAQLGNDEVGQLVGGFNEMLSQIQAGEKELRTHREHLAAEVAERTVELTRVNQSLLLSKEKAEQARQAADEANHTKSTFLANMSHELRTPLNAIIGYSEMLQEEVNDLEQAHLIPDLQKIETAGKHLLRLINDVLDLSKVEAGKMTLYAESFDLANLAREVTATVLPLVLKNGNKLEVSCSDEIGSMHADLTKVRQTLFNLLSNASKFTENGRIWLQMERLIEAGREWIYIRVQDSGIGMTPDQISRLFEAFTQADTGITRKYGGTGLGLALSRKFCQLMGGDLTVTSQIGQGSTFTVRLPAQIAMAPGEVPGASDSADSFSAMAGRDKPFAGC